MANGNWSLDYPPKCVPSECSPSVEILEQVRCRGQQLNDCFFIIKNGVGDFVTKSDNKALKMQIFEKHF